MIKSVSINIRPDDIASAPLLWELIDFFSSREIKVLLLDNSRYSDSRYKERIVSQQDFIHTPDLVIVIGGDGTFLRTARLFIDEAKPIFGINRGRLGFLTEFNPQECFRYLEECIEDNFQTTERSVLEAIHCRSGRVLQRQCFINDAVISKGSFSRAIMIDIKIDNNDLSSYLGDGIIISTPTGSTAYSLSAGGPIIVPSAKDLFLLSPICPHTLAVRPIIIPAESIVTARILSQVDNLLLTIDGQEVMKIESNDDIVFKQSQKIIRLITHPEKNFYAILREKLGWG